MGCVLVSSIRRAATSRKPGRCPTLICRRTFRSSTWEAMVTRWFTQPVNSSRLSSSAFLDPSNVATVRMEVLSAIAPDVEPPFGKKAKRQNSRCRFLKGILNFRCDEVLIWVAPRFQRLERTVRERGFSQRGTQRLKPVLLGILIAGLKACAT